MDKEEKLHFYNDRTTSAQRSYSFIRNEDKKDLSKSFFFKENSITDIKLLDDDSKESYDLIERILQDISNKNSTLKPFDEIDPINLAKSVWQDIYVSTGKDPTKCLYNVVELFIFKFLSDLGVLVRDKSFDHLIKMYNEKYPNKEVLEHYAQKSRAEIRKLFPKGQDGTTIINGTIFVDPNGDAVESQATLFKNSILKYSQFGSLKHIKKEFKTKLFETFLKQSQDKSKLGQFFTPRKVVQAIIDMAGIDELPRNSRICDPFCGVGGFVLEPLHKSKLKREFLPKNNKLNPKYTLLGFDRGTDHDEERTIILAKANMLIYLSEIIEKYPSLTSDFASLFNSTFLLLKTNLGSFSNIFDKEENKMDLILTNPPYITSGIKSIKEEIAEENLENYYANSGKGAEGLALRWIINNLKKGGKAFVVIPDSILNVSSNESLRNDLLNECYINCLISLPIKTFFNTPKKTYILGITKKEDKEESQKFPVFTYLVSDIGETLNVNRFETEGKSDLEKAKELFNQFKGSPDTYSTDDLRCKIQPIKKFMPNDFWTIDKWWTKEEKIILGVEQEDSIISIDEFKEHLEDFSEKINDSNREIDILRQNGDLESDYKEFHFEEIFDLKKGKSIYTKKYVNNNKGDFPIYSSNTKQKGLFGHINSHDFDEECIYITTNGVNAGTVFYKEKHKFSVNGDGGILKKKHQNLNYIYLLFELKKAIIPFGFNWENKPSEDKLKLLKLKIPITKSGSFDLKKQEEIANKFNKLEKIKEKLRIQYENMIESEIQLN